MKRLVTFPALMIGKTARMRNTKQILAAMTMEFDFPEVDADAAPHVMDLRSLDDTRTIPYRYWQGRLMRPLFDGDQESAFDFSIGDGALRRSAAVFGKLMDEIAKRVADVADDATFPKKLDAEIYSTVARYNDGGARWRKPAFHDACVEVATKIEMDALAQEGLDYWRGRALAALDDLAIIDGVIWHTAPEPFWSASRGNVTLTGDYEFKEGDYNWESMSSRFFPVDQLDEAVAAAGQVSGTEVRVDGGAAIHSLEFRTLDTPSVDLARFSRCAVKEFRKWISRENHRTSNPMFVRDMPKAVLKAWAELAADTSRRADLLSVDDGLADKLATFCEALEREAEWAEGFFQYEVSPQTIRDVLDAWSAREVGFDMGFGFASARTA